MQRYCDTPPPPSCWDVLFEAYKRRRDPEGCLNLIQSMYRAAPGSSRSRKPKDKTSPSGGFFSMRRLFNDFICKEDFDDSRSTEFVDEAEAPLSRPAAEPTATHWYHTVHAFALHRGGRAAYDQLCRMREVYEAVPSLECYTCALDALIAQDEPEVIGEVLRYMNEDGVPVAEDTRERMQQMRRYDIVLEAMDSMGGLNGTSR